MSGRSAQTDDQFEVPTAAVAIACAELFQQSLQQLYSQFPNRYINALCGLALHALESGQLTFGVGHTDTPLGFVIMGNRPIVVASTDWQLMATQHLGLGSVCYVASYISDYLHRRLGEFSLPRARAYETEYYNTALDVLDEEIEFDRLRTGFMHEYPNGLRSLPAGVYYPMPACGDAQPLPPPL